MTEPSDLYPPKPHIVDGALISSMSEYQRLYRLSLDDPETFWAKQAERLTWFHPWIDVFDHDYDNVDFGWYLGGRLNACFNCVDRHLNDRGDQVAIIWAKDEPGQYERITDAASGDLLADHRLALAFEFCRFPGHGRLAGAPPRRGAVREMPAYRTIPRLAQGTRSCRWSACR